jgi:hypothetical protein
VVPTGPSAGQRAKKRPTMTAVPSSTIGEQT